MTSFFNAIYEFATMHPWVVFTLYLCYAAFVGSLKAPTAQSKQWYVSLFAVLNALSMQFGRMFPKVEDSPNFQPAFNLQQKIAGQPITTVRVPPLVEDQHKP